MKKKKSTKKSKSTNATSKTEQAVALLKIYTEKCKEKQIIPNFVLLESLNGCINDDETFTKLWLDFTLSNITTSENGTSSCDMKLLVNSVLIAKTYNISFIGLNHATIADEEMTDLILLLGHKKFIITSLELTNCMFSFDSAKRLSSSFIGNNLKSICLDYTVIDEEKCKLLCYGLFGNLKLCTLNMNYCNLQPVCGTYIGQLIMESTLRELSLNGNYLQCDGFVELVKLAVDFAEMEMQHVDVNKTEGIPDKVIFEDPIEKKKAKSSGKSGKGKKKGKKKSNKISPQTSKIGPYLTTLCIENNGIDIHGTERTYGPMVCIQLLRKWIKFSPYLKTINIDGNNIGSACGGELIEGLKERKENGLKSIRLTVSHYMESDCFSKIITLGSGKEKKKKGKKKKKK